MNSPFGFEAHESLPTWKWAALFSPLPAPLVPHWQNWLALSQREEEETRLRYWAHRAEFLPGAPPV